MDARLKILLVDDYPTILKLIARSLGKSGEFITARDGIEGLKKAVEHKPDFIISDYAMPNMDGRMLLNKLRERDDTKQIPFAFLVSQKEIDENLRMLVKGVEDFFVKPFLVEDLSQAGRRILDRIRSEKFSKMGGQDGVIAGRLSEMNIMDLMTSLEMGRKNCALKLTSDAGDCTLYFAEGQVIHAESGQTVGDEAVYKAVGWAEGRWELNFPGKTDKKTITQPTQGLLMEGLRLLDEANRRLGEAGM